MEKIDAAGGIAVAIQADLGEEAEVTALSIGSATPYGGIDVIVHTAGIVLLSLLVDLSFDDFDRMRRTNVRGAFLVT